MLEMIVWTTYISMINIVFYTLLSPGAFKVDQTHKFRSYTVSSDLTGQSSDRNE